MRGVGVEKTAAKRERAGVTADLCPLLEDRPGCGFVLELDEVRKTA